MIHTQRLIGWGVAALLLLDACSSVTDSTGPSDSSPTIPPGYARFAGTIHDAAGAPISGASVMVPFGSNQAWMGQTNAAGQYDFNAKASDLDGVSPFAMVVYKDRYTPRTFYYAKIVDGGTFNLTTDATNAPRQLQANEFVPEGAYRLWHLGDANFTGAINSNLQVSTSGLAAGFPVVTWTSQLAQQYRSATISLVMRGVQSSLCPADRVGVYAEGMPLSNYRVPSDGDQSGKFSAYQLSVTLPTVPVGTRLMFGVMSGKCTMGDMDDFEFAQVLVTLQP